MTEPDARLVTAEEATDTVLGFTGRLDAAGVGRLWHAAIRAATAARGRGLVFDVAGVAAFDMTGAALLAAAEAAHGGPASLRGGTPQLRALFDRARAAGTTAPPPAQPAPFGLLKLFRAGLTAAGDGLAFLGEATIALLRLPFRRRMFRLADTLRQLDHAGFRALPLVLMLGYLMGLILAFQSAIPMRRFGADLFVANLVSISLFRELGPLLSAVILSGRTGSAFAAEIGTMKVNQEVDALVVMGLDPMTMLVLPRLVAAMLVMPALTLMLNFAGLLGMTTVMTAFGYSVRTIMLQVQYAATVRDLLGGLVKSVCFGAAVAAVGCRSGLGTGIGPRAVGESATAAVVGGIVATIALDGLFAVIFYRLGL